MLLKGDEVHKCFVIDAMYGYSWWNIVIIKMTIKIQLEKKTVHVVEMNPGKAACVQVEEEWKDKSYFRCKETFFLSCLKFLLLYC